MNEIENLLCRWQLKPLSTKKINLLLEDNATDALRRFILSSPSNTLVVIGDYGAGKTTVLQKMMRLYAEEKLNNKYSHLYKIPIYINLKDFNKVLDIHGLIQLFLKDVVGGDNATIRTFKKLNEEGRFILFLDAFDEMLTKVTKPDRRRCFREISQLVSKNSKIILTGRPAYFNDYEELRQNLDLLKCEFYENGQINTTTYEVLCLQLFDEEQVEEYFKNSPVKESNEVLDIVLQTPSLMDLARRPVLASMIASSGKDLRKLRDSNLSARNIYEIYTNRWIEREEDKGKFRLLFRSSQKSTFVRYLAMQMHVSGTLLVHYKELDHVVGKYFDLDPTMVVDHFSHEIRTCSFLSCTHDGYYFFIHKSFMEFFVACEFERMENSPFADKFANPLTNEIIELLDFGKLPQKMIKIWRSRENLERLIKIIKHDKDTFIRRQRYEEASSLRDIEKLMLEFYNNLKTIFSMNYREEYNNLTILKAELEKHFTIFYGSTELRQNIEEYLKTLN